MRSKERREKWQAAPASLEENCSDCSGRLCALSQVGLSAWPTRLRLAAT